MARAIIRYSFDGPAKGTRGKMRALLRDADFEELGTASFEARNVQLDGLVRALQEALEVARNPAAGVRLDHLWIYLDESNEAI